MKYHESETISSVTTTSEDSTKFWYDDDTAPIFGILVSIRVLVALISVVGNSMVIYAFMKNKESVGKSFRYLNRVVLSLSITDFIHSILGMPFDFLYWYYNLSELGPQRRSDGRTWIMSIVTFPQDVCTGASCYHVTLIVFLRCLCLIRPMTFEKWHNRVSTISIIGIWISMVVIVLSPTIISTQMTTKEGKQNSNTLYGSAWNVVDILTIATPVLLNVIFCCLKFHLLRKRRMDKETGGDFSTTVQTTTCDSKGTTKAVTSNYTARPSRQKTLENMIKLVAIGTVVCYTPDIVFRAYSWERLRQNLPIYSQHSTGMVLFSFFARLSVQIAGVINPFIYATTIPQFKELATRYLRRFFETKVDEQSTKMRLNTADISTTKNTGIHK